MKEPEKPAILQDFHTISKLRKTCTKENLNADETAKLEDIYIRSQNAYKQCIKEYKVALSRKALEDAIDQMPQDELEDDKKLSYDDLCTKLENKYGKPNGAYFTNKKCCSPNNKIKRATEGLQIHHVMEKEDITGLSKAYKAAEYPWTYQQPDNLVFCNLFEHYLLHAKLHNTSTLGLALLINQIDGVVKAYTNNCQWWEGQKVEQIIKESKEEETSIMGKIWWYGRYIHISPMCNDENEKASYEEQCKEINNMLNAYMGLGWNEYNFNRTLHKASIMLDIDDDFIYPWLCESSIKDNIARYLFDYQTNIEHIHATDIFHYLCYTHQLPEGKLLSKNSKNIKEQSISMLSSLSLRELVMLLPRPINFSMFLHS